MKQALIFLDCPTIESGWWRKDVDTLSHMNIRKMHVIANPETSCNSAEDISESRERLVTRETDAFREIALSLSSTNTNALIQGCVPIDAVEKLACVWDARSWWDVPTPQEGIYRVFRRISCSSFIDERWWPPAGATGNTAIFYTPEELGAYGHRLVKAFENHDAKKAFNLMFLPRSRYQMLAQLIKTTGVYLYGGGMTANAPAVWYFFSNSLSVDVVLHATIQSLTSHGYHVYRGEKINEILYWVKHKHLPESMTLLGEPSIG